MADYSEHGQRAGNWAVFALGLLLALIGAGMTAGGAWLALLGGSLYYVLAGLGLLVAGLLMMRGLAAGAWLYIAVYVATAIWAFWEAGGDGWALVPRLVGPSVLLLLVVAALAPLSPGRIPGRTAGAAVVAVFVAMIVGGALVAVIDTGAPVHGVAASGGAGMTEPSLRSTGADWPAYAGTNSARHYSPLDQINRGNVDDLERVWVAHTGDLPEDMTDNSYGAETTPLKVGNTLYLCSATNILIALDPATGEERWRYDPGVSKDWIPYTAACRGVSYYEVPNAAPDQACAKRIIEGTLDGRLVAVDAGNGQPCADFGNGGSVDIKAGMGAVVPGMVSITSAPAIVRGVVVTGHQVLDGQKLDAPSGVIQGFDAVTGEQRWAWDMTRPDLTGQPPEGDSYTRGTPNMWTTASGDEALGLVYLPMGNAAVDYWSGGRSEEENRYSTSLVAIDVTTGKVAWSFQTVHKDVWDYDLGSQPTLVDFPTGNGAVPALLLTSKQGDIYVLDRRTGQPLTDVQERPVPQGGVEPDQRAADAALLRLSHAAAAVAGRGRHVGHVADRPDDLPHPVPSRRL